MPVIYGTPEHWLARAQEARETAEAMSSPDARHAMLAVAENYEKIAHRAQVRAAAASRETDAPKGHRRAG